MKEFDKDLEHALEEERKEYEELGRECEKTMKYVVTPIAVLIIIISIFLLAPYVDNICRTVPKWYHKYYQNVLNNSLE